MMNKGYGKPMAAKAAMAKPMAKKVAKKMATKSKGAMKKAK
jgi:hypothetical protein